LKANLLQAFGPDHLRFTEVPDPSPGPGEVMIRVVASGVNPVDYYTVTGMRNVSPMPHIPGVEVAGEVVKVGQGVQGVEPGDRVVVYPTAPATSASQATNTSVATAASTASPAMEAGQSTP